MTTGMEFLGMKWELEKTCGGLTLLANDVDGYCWEVIRFENDGRYSRAITIPLDMDCFDLNQRGQIKQDKGDLDPCFYDGECGEEESPDCVFYLGLKWVLQLWTGTRGQEMLAVVATDHNGSRCAPICITSDGHYLRPTGAPECAGVAFNSRGQIKQAK